MIEIECNDDEKIKQIREAEVNLFFNFENVIEIQAHCEMTAHCSESTKTDTMLLSRFKGALVGAVVADCIGANFEGMPKVKVSKILDLYQKLEKEMKKHHEKGTSLENQYKLPYTDDTAMARCIMNSLLQKKTLDSPHLAKSFAEEYQREPDRGYGGNVVSVFERLADPDLENVFEPASEQFDGSGSYGNGGAMRIVPVPLFLYHQNSLPELEEMTCSITRLTHTNPQAIHGALLQAFAVDLSLRLPQSNVVDSDSFCDELIKKLKPIEEAQNGKDTPSPSPVKKIPPKRNLDAEPLPYCAKLEKVKEFSKAKDLSPATVESVLGNDVSALGSVPAAVLSFLRGVNKEVAGDEKEENPLKRVVTYAISLGGDTDTIATMAAGMAGAFFGLESIPKEWQFCCEGVEDADRAAEEFHRLLKEHWNMNENKPDDENT